MKTFKLPQILITAFILSSSSFYCKAQSNDSKYKAIPVKYITSQTSYNTYHSEALSARQGAYDLTASLPAGYVKDGSVDYSQYLQKAINSNTTVLMPDFPVLVNQNGLSLKDNSVIIFNKNSSLLLTPTSTGNYAILKAYNVKNVKIYEPVIIGDRKKHNGKTGEWGMGISVRGSVNVTIYNPKVSECWGDGIYVDDINNIRSENVTIYNARLDFNRRNGISVVSVKGLKIIDPVISNTVGTSPQSGIDIEPDTNGNTIEDVQIENPITFNNTGSGIEVCLKALPGPVQRKVNISINGHTDEQSTNGFRLVGFNDHYVTNTPLDGQILVTNSKLINNTTPVLGNTNYDIAPNITMNNISIVKRDKNGNDSVDKDAINILKKTFSNKQRIKVQ